jgi:50S ribosomal protein L16 3-hydroxylase
LPRVTQPGWTLLVQGVDLHHAGAYGLLQHFRFVPDARLDDLMISWASEGGGIGPHVDSYDVFLLQGSGTRRWRIAQHYDPALDASAPLKVLRRFDAEQELVLEPGDLLYLPPNWAHEGVAAGGNCMTYSIGMRTPQRGSLSAELVQRLAETYDDPTLYRDTQQPATATPAAIPAPLQRFAASAIRRLMARPGALACALGEVLSEPKPQVWFTKRSAPWRPRAVVLDRRTRMLYDAHHVFINGEAVRVQRSDAVLLRRLADERTLEARAVRRGTRRVKALLGEWFAAGWLADHSDAAATPAKPAKRPGRV